MIRTSHSILVQRDIEDVYRFVVVDFFENYCKWSPEVVELHQLTTGEMRVGVTGRQVRYDGGYRSESLFEVTHYEPLRDLRFVSRSKPSFEVAYLFKAVAAQTRLTFNFQLELPFFMRPWRSLIEETVERGGWRVVHNLKKLLEGESVAIKRETNGSSAEAGPATDSPGSGRGFRD